MTTSYASVRSSSRVLAAPSRVTLEGPDLVRKRGKVSLLRREVEAMTYVQQNTSIPIPTIHQTYYDEDDPKSETSWVSLQRIPGLQLVAAWSDMSEEARSQTIQQLRSCLDQLHQLHTPSTDNV